MVWSISSRSGRSAAAAAASRARARRRSMGTTVARRVVPVRHCAIRNGAGDDGTIHHSQMSVDLPGTRQRQGENVRGKALMTPWRCPGHSRRPRRLSTVDESATCMHKRGREASASPGPPLAATKLMERVENTCHLPEECWLDGSASKLSRITLEPKERHC